MPSYRFHLVNVFAETPFGGNPLAVFEPADGLDSTTMQAIAAQMNLSETTFVFPATEGGDARVRIFTPGYELPFAGHPVLGTAAVLARLRGLSASVRLEMAAGMFPIVLGEGGYAQLTAKPAQVRPFTGEQDALADMLGLGAGALRDARFVNTGTEQLLIELTSRDAVLACRPSAAGIDALCRNVTGAAMAYVWHVDGAVATVRLFFTHNGQVIEDPGTGSACANLGGWLASDGRRGLHWRLEQGLALNRPNVLDLEVDAAGVIRVGGRVMPVGSGQIDL